MNMIVAVDQNYAIGYRNNLGWHITEDLQRFRSLTLHKTVIMGRKTWESIYSVLGQALPQRHNFVLTRDLHYHAPGATVIHDMRDVLSMHDKQVFIIGGEQIYKIFLPYVTTLYLTSIEKNMKHADAYFPRFNHQHFQQTYFHRYYSRKERCYFSFNVYHQVRATIEEIL
jgi:dihydrofolate reductase